MEIFQSQIPDIPDWKHIFGTSNKAVELVVSNKSVSKKNSVSSFWILGGCLLTIAIIVLLAMLWDKHNEKERQSKEEQKQYASYSNTSIKNVR